MRRIVLGLITAAVCCFLMAGCGSTQKTQTNSATAQQAQSDEQQSELNCDEFMQQLADGCFAVTAFEEDNVTPLHVLDEAGNDLGEVDQIWVAGYCECYAQLAFQTFGCLQVVEHENLDDATYALTYEPIVAACAEPPEVPQSNDWATENNSSADNTAN